MFNDLDDYKQLPIPKNLDSCPFCGTLQIQVITIDRKDKSRDLMKCRHCKGQAMRRWWYSEHRRSIRNV